MAIKTCQRCGKPLPEIHGNNRKYCSVICRRKANQNVTRIKDATQRVSHIKHDIYAAYDYKCALCGWQATTELVKTKRGYLHSRGNEIHHITPVSEGGGENWQNIILLCPCCHKKADLDLISKETLIKHTVDFVKEKERLLMLNTCSYDVARAIFKGLII